MFKNNFVVWPNDVWDKWYFYDIFSNKKLSMRIKNMTKDEQIKFFWTNLNWEEKEKELKEGEEKLIFTTLFENDLLNNEKIYTKFNIPIRCFDALYSVNIDFEEHIGKNFISDLRRKITSLQNESKTNNRLNFYLSPAFNPNKLVEKIESQETVIPITITESDLIIGPLLSKHKCPCPTCLHIRMGASSIDYQSFDRHIRLNDHYNQFLRCNLFDSRYSNIDDLTAYLINEYVREYGKGNKNVFVRYNLHEGKMYINQFLSPPH